ncbi:MAG: SDR family oxidoreductase [Parasphingopyxis sp.]|uniref:SDR family oxidoreductase n=1 Tax=Parasphingopyxis sp. TaxID=1920299 RepID=UPI0032EDE0D4
MINPVTLFDISGKSAMITGATSGIGRMIAEGLSAAGARIWVVARTDDDVAAMTESLSQQGGAQGIVADIATAEGIAAVREALGDAALNILVNNAGTNRDTPLAESRREDFDAVLGLNLSTPFHLVQAVLPNLRTAAQKDDPARVINISSVASIHPGGYENYAYSASKTGLLMLTRHLGRKLASDDITVNAIAPGLFPSRLTETFMGVGAGDDAPKGFQSPIAQRMGTPEDIAGAIIYLSSRAGAWVSGITIPVAGGVFTVS